VNPIKTGSGEVAVQVDSEVEDEEVEEVDLDTREVQVWVITRPRGPQGVVVVDTVDQIRDLMVPDRLLYLLPLMAEEEGLTVHRLKLHTVTAMEMADHRRTLTLEVHHRLIHMEAEAGTQRHRLHMEDTHRHFLVVLGLMALLLRIHTAVRPLLPLGTGEGVMEVEAMADTEEVEVGEGMGVVVDVVERLQGIDGRKSNV
jgi:hypothetical protein